MWTTGMTLSHLLIGMPTARFTELIRLSKMTHAQGEQTQNRRSVERLHFYRHCVMRTASLGLRLHKRKNNFNAYLHGKMPQLLANFQAWWIHRNEDCVSRYRCNAGKNSAHVRLRGDETDGTEGIASATLSYYARGSQCQPPAPPFS